MMDGIMTPPSSESEYDSDSTVEFNMERWLEIREGKNKVLLDNLIKNHNIKECYIILENINQLIQKYVIKEENNLKNG